MSEGICAEPRRIGFYAGTFDPVTTGHLDVIERAARLVDRLVIGVAKNPGKNPLMPLDERVACVEEALPAIASRVGGDLKVVSFDSLLVEAVRAQGASLIFRGLRVLTDFDYEIQMSGVNRRLAPGIETVFLMASERTQFISSRLVKEIAGYHGDISEFVTPGTQKRLLARLKVRAAG
ncbi:pantetheine-phosphate adenylyltransferase [Acetobacter persici]|uniref:pantetheine-phosphate adenylyltransferase n=1 Tax=Acetobacter persici TaxID=1076596 RepID=UPI001BA647B5|nr:pantetheine-phosphate adenylyltransferase [Acetobacter persici]